jgi:hypothetical protein
MTEPADRHQVHATDLPFTVAIWRPGMDSQPIELRPDHPVVKLLLQEPKVRSVTMHTDDPGETRMFLRVDKLVRPDWGFGDETLDLAADVVIAAIRGYAQTIQVRTDTDPFGPTVDTVIDQVLDFATRSGIAPPDGGLPLIARQRIAVALVEGSPS